MKRHKSPGSEDDKSISLSNTDLCEGRLQILELTDHVGCCMRVFCLPDLLPALLDHDNGTLSTSLSCLFVSATSAFPTTAYLYCLGTTESQYFRSSLTTIFTMPVVSATLLALLSVFGSFLPASSLPLELNGMKMFAGDGTLPAGDPGNPGGVSLFLSAPSRESLD